MIGFLFALAVVVAPQDTNIARLPTVEVRVGREPARTALELPYALTRLVPDSSRPGLRNASIDERLFAIPGMFVANRHNPSQDPRISIRGFGSRSTFGVRGVRVQMDGVPLTLPDGQTALDYLDLETIGSIEVIRGSASALYGNAAGGVIDLRSKPAPESRLGVRVGHWGADFFQRKWSGAVGGTSGSTDYMLSFSRLESEGFRFNSEQKVTNGSFRLNTLLGNVRMGAGILVHDMPLAQNPGALTRQEMTAGPEAERTADPATIVKKARKEVSQIQAGLTFALGDAERGEIELVLHGGARDLNNPLQFAIVDVERSSGGVGVRATRDVRLFDRPLRLTGGIDYQRQTDDRTEFTNCNDDPPLLAPTANCPDIEEERGSLRRDQKEMISSLGPYLRGELQMSERFWLSAGLRADRVNFEVDDAFIEGTNPDDSGERTLSAVSPTLGLVYRAGERSSLYATFSTAFETPSATELGNKTDGSAGFNTELEPQKSATFEIGSRGWMRGLVPSGLSYDVAVYRTSVDDELIPFEIPGGAGRRYFRNAGSTSRTGFESSLATRVGPAELMASYTYSHFLFEDYEVAGVRLDDNRIPGIPIQQVQGAATFRRGHWYLTMEGEARGSVFVDDANTAGARSPGYELMHVRIGASLGKGQVIAPRIGVQNVFNRRYAASLSINAGGGRYFEPAPGRTFFGGLTIGVGGMR